ncbi:MAG: hypothetical protein IPN32_12520, partial [Deltaproteobacteria bacterium]|nr:hypothetical protein [Deltaproteobacteria bacterium]
MPACCRRRGRARNLLAHAQDEGATAELDAEAAALPLVVMVERTRVVAVDPIHGRTR